MKVVIALLAAVCTGCGTNTGNPVVNSGQPALSPVYIANTLTATVCAKVVQCSTGANFDECYDRAGNSPGYTSELGTNASAFATMKELATAESTGALQVTSSEGTSCETAISNLSCSDPLVVNAHSAATPGDYSATNTLFRASPSCRNIY